MLRLSTPTSFQKERKGKSIPCDQIQVATVSLGIKTDKNLLVKALEALGYRANQIGESISLSKSGLYGTYNAKTGDVNFVGIGEQQAQKEVAQIKRSYSAQVVQSQAQKFGWQVKKLGQFEFQLVKNTL